MSEIVRNFFEPFLNKQIIVYADEHYPRYADQSEALDKGSTRIPVPETIRGALSNPLIAQIALTSSCNLHCEFCYAAIKESDSDLLTTSKIENIIDQLHALNVIYLEWAGGEPTLRDDFIHLIAYAGNLHFKQSALINGTCISDDFILAAKNYLFNLQVSVDDFDSFYNKIKGAEMWERLSENLTRLVNGQVSVTASVLLNENNFERIEKIAEFIGDKGIRRLRFSWQVPMGKSDYLDQNSYASFVKNAIKKVNQLKSKYRSKGLEISALHEKMADSTSELLPKEFLLCSAGRSRLHIHWNGEAFLVPF